MNQIRKVLSLIVLATTCAAWAQDGSSAYNFLNITSSARIYGLGGVNITLVEDDIATVDQNPALLGPEMTNQVSVGYMRYIGGANFAGLRYGRAAGERGAWTAAIRYFGYGSIQGADIEGNLTGTFSPKDLAFGGGYSHDITDRLRGGIDVKFLYSSYEQYSALAVSTDLGINYYDPDNDFSASVVVANLGGQLKRFSDRHDKLPTDLRLGLAKSFGDFPVRFSVTAWNLTKWHLPYVETGDGTNTSWEVKDTFSSNLFRHLVFGADFVPNDRMYITLGYNYKTRTDMSTYQRNMLSGFSLGAGLNVNQFKIGLAFSQPHTGATTFMLNLNMDLNDLLH